MNLLPQHQELIERSGISAAVANARGYRSAQTKSELSRLGFTSGQQNVPALLIPLHNVWGEREGYLLRPDEPRQLRGRICKYEMPKGASMVVDVPPPARDRLGDPSVPLYITEGSRKADAAVSHGLLCISLTGVWCWRGTNDHGGKVLLPDFESIAFNDREVFVVFDSDVMTKEAVHAALERFVPVLKRRGARVRIVYLPPGESGAKVGLDDFLAAGGSPEDLLALAEDGLRPMTTHPAANQYEATADGVVWHKPARAGGTQPVLLTNFLAQVVADTVRDDGAETTRWFTVEAQVHGRCERFEVEAGRFGEMGWVLEQVGADAIIDGGQGSRERTRAAIQHLSGPVVQHRRYAHTGWREINDAWVYLHAGGAIGANGIVEDVAVELQAELDQIELPAPPTEDALVQAVRASLQLLDLGPASVIVPVLGAVYRAPLGSVDFSLFLSGRTGVFKTELAALAQQHWGARLDSRNLPASWSSTANWTEAVLFAAKDALCVVDDFAPGGTSNDLSRAHRDADRVFRSQGNQAGRGRMRADSSLRRATIPRGLPVATGEDVPRGHSLRARLVIVPIADGDISVTQLTAAQAAGGDGVYAAAMAGFVRWLAGRRALVVRELPELLRELRDTAPAGAHRRTSANEAHLVAGFHYFLAFAEETGAIGAGERQAILEKARVTLAESGEAQAAHHEDADPVRRFLDLLASEISAGRAHVAEKDGSRPAEALAWGWRIPPNESDWRPHGRRIGWIEEQQLYLDLPEACGCAQRLADELGERIPLDPSALSARLHEAGLLASTNLGNSRRTYRVRRTIQSRRREVIHLKTTALDPDAIPDPSRPHDRHPPLTNDRGPVNSVPRDTAGSAPPAASHAPTTHPTSPEHRNDRTHGSNGRTGRALDEGPAHAAPTRPGVMRELTNLGGSAAGPDQPDHDEDWAAGPQAVTDAALRALPWPPNPPADGTTWSEDL